MYIANYTQIQWLKTTSILTQPLGLPQLFGSSAEPSWALEPLWSAASKRGSQLGFTSPIVNGGVQICPPGGSRAASETFPVLVLS